MVAGTTMFSWPPLAVLHHLRGLSLRTSEALPRYMAS